jgi:ubiquinone/menaquinone biosynthesis C-methylase UbiE
MIDKNIERRRYDNRAILRLNTRKFDHVNQVPAYLSAPYEYYFKLFERKGDQSKLLEIGAGMGENTGLLIDMSYKVCSTDISPKSVEVMNKRFSDYRNFSAEVADMEKLPFNDESFGVVCSAGSLGYGDNAIVMNEIYRVLKQGGIFIAVDALNNNPIYRLNRYIRYLRGGTSLSIIKRIPNLKLLQKYEQKFGKTEVKFFGAITYLSPILNELFGENKTTIISDCIDRMFSIKRSAFKFVLIAEKK